MEKVLKNIIKIAIIMLFILINANYSYALTESEVKNLKKGDSLEVTKNSKIYQNGGAGIYLAEDFPDKTGVKKGERITAGTPLSYKGSYTTKDGKYYVAVDYEHGSCYVHYSNLKLRTVSEEEKSKVDTFLEKDIVQDVKKGGKNKDYSDQEIIDVLKESKKLVEETGNNDIKDVLKNAETILTNRGYLVEADDNGSLTIKDNDGNVIDSVKGSNKTNTDNSNSIYYQPSKNTSGDSSEENLDDLITDAEEFVDSGETGEVGVIDSADLQNFSKTLYNILLSIGVAAAVIVGALLGIKLMTASVEEKAEVQKMLVPYVVGCIVIFGGFTIWKIAVDILSKI